VPKKRLKFKLFEFFKRKKLPFLLLVLLFFAAFLRFFRLGSLLGFWYDQGRDALVVWDLLHYGKFFLIGPTTGIEGIFLGPFYYYLLAIFYWLGAGSPVIAAGGLVLLTVLAIFLLYLLADEVYDKQTALLSVFLYSFSYSLVIFSRWLANPNPLPFFTLILLILLYGFIKGKRNYLILALFVCGLCLQLEAASAVFFLPAILIILLWQRKSLSFRYLALAVLAFFTTLLPQIIFNFRHDGILVNAFNKFLLEERSFKLSLLTVAKARLLLYYDVFLGTVIPHFPWLRLFGLALFSANTFFFRKKIFNQGGKLLAVWLVVPMTGFFFYQGNHGYVWDYYFSGAIPAFVILLAAGLINLFKKNFLWKVIVCLFLFGFLTNNIRLLKNYYQAGMGITLKSEKWAIDWIYKEAGNGEFNIDVYVPPQVYFSYSYLFHWYGKGKYGREPQTKLVKNLYTLYEPDHEHPFFLEAWLERQEGIGKIIKSDFYGDITVQKRESLKLLSSSKNLLKALTKIPS